MDWLAIVCLALAAIALAANQALKDAPVLTARLQWLRPKPWWNYLPLTFLVIAGIFWGVSNITGGPSYSPLGVGPNIDGIPADRISGFFSEERTNAEAEALTEPFVGVPVKISGEVRDVNIEPEYVMVNLDGPLLGPTTLLIFSPDHQRTLARFTKGDSLHADCIFKRATSLGLSFSECHLSPPRDEPSPVSQAAP